MARPFAQIDYELLARLTGKSYDAVAQDVTRKRLDPTDFVSVLLYIARNGEDGLKVAIFRAMATPSGKAMRNPKKGRRKKKGATRKSAPSDGARGRGRPSR